MMNYDEYHKLNLFGTSIVTLKFQKKASNVYDLQAIEFLISFKKRVAHFIGFTVFFRFFSLLLSVIS